MCNAIVLMLVLEIMFMFLENSMYLENMYLGNESSCTSELMLSRKFHCSL